MLCDVSQAYSIDAAPTEFAPFCQHPYIGLSRNQKIGGSENKKKRGDASCPLNHPPYRAAWFLGVQQRRDIITVRCLFPE